MLAFVFCLHAHLKRIQAIITRTVSHTENVHQIHLHTKTLTLTRCYLKCRSITFTRQCNVIKISSCISHSTLSPYQMRHRQPIFLSISFADGQRFGAWARARSKQRLSCSQFVYERVCDVRKMVNTFWCA